MYLDSERGVINLFNQIKRGVFGDLEQRGFKAAFGTEDNERLLYIVYLEGGNMALILVAKTIMQNTVGIMVKLKQINVANVEVWGMPPMSMESYYKNRYNIIAGFTNVMNQMYGTSSYREFECTGKDFETISSWFKENVRNFHIKKIIMVV